MPKIVKHNKIWCIQESFPMSDKPEMIIYHWPIGITDDSYHRVALNLSSYEESEVMKGSCSYEYRLRTAGTHEYIYLYLKDQGKTKSIHTIVEAIPCPKVRKGIETRWYNGRWEKLLKTGWKSA